MALATWLRWLYYEGKSYENIVGVARRLQLLVDRVEQWEILREGA